MPIKIHKFNNDMQFVYSKDDEELANYAECALCNNYEPSNIIFLTRDNKFCGACVYHTIRIYYILRKEKIKQK